MQRLNYPVTLLWVLLASVLTLTVFAAEPFYIRTVAGGGPAPTGNSLNVFTWNIYGIAIDPAGNTYFAEEVYNRVRRIDGAGNTILIAGNGRSGFSGDGGLAVDATINRPSGIALNAAGNVLFIGDALNHRVRRVDLATGIITTVAGTGIAGFTGDGSQATLARMNNPIGLAVDSANNLLIADRSNNRIRRVTPGGVITTIVGNGTGSSTGDAGQAVAATINQPHGIALDAADNLYIVDRSGQRIRRVIAATGIIDTIAGNGTAGGTGPSGRSSVNDPQNAIDVAPNGTLFNPLGIAVNAAGTAVFFCDQSNDRIRVVDLTVPFPYQLRTVAGTFSAANPPLNPEGFSNTLPGLFNDPFMLAFHPSGDLIVTDRNNHRLRRITMNASFAATAITTIFGTGSVGSFLPNGQGGDGIPAINAYLHQPRGVAVDSAGHIYVSDSVNHRIRRIDALTGIITTYAGAGVNANGTGAGGFAGNGIAATDPTVRMNQPQDLMFDDLDNLYICDRYNHRIRMVRRSDGLIFTVSGDGTAAFADALFPVNAVTAGRFNEPVGIFVRRAGNAVTLWIADKRNFRIRKSIITDYTTSTPTIGDLTTVAGNGTDGFANNASALAGSFNDPTGVVINSLNEIFVSDTDNHRIRKFTEGGALTTIAGDGVAGSTDRSDNPLLARFSSPIGIKLEPVTQNLIIADVNSQRIRRVVYNLGTGLATAVQTIAGEGNAGHGGDGGPALLATFWSPYNVAFDAAGDIYVVAEVTCTVRKLYGTLPLARITAITPATPVASNAFSVTVQLQTPAGQPIPAGDDTVIQLSRFAGTGTVGGTTTATIRFKQSSVVFPAVTYSVAENGVQLTATRVSGDFVTAANSAAFNVVATVPAVAWGNPSFIIAGTALSGQQLNALANVPGTFAYNPPLSTVLPVGLQQNLQATFTPTDIANYSVVNVSVKLDVYAKLTTALPPTATPNPANVGESVSFSWGANVPDAVFTWDFRDNTPTRTGVSVTHGYIAAGTFFVKVIVTHALTAQSSVEVLEVVVKDPNATGGGGGGGGGGGATASATDTDGDGFSDAIEVGTGSSPSDAGSTPFGLAKPAAGNLLQIDKMSVKVSFVKSNADSVQLSGVLPVTAAFGGQRVLFDIGGIIQSFTLNAKGIGGDKTNGFKLGKPKNGAAKFLLKLKNGAFLAKLADEQIVEQNAAGERRVIKVYAVFGAKTYEREAEQIYKAKRGVGGATK